MPAIQKIRKRGPLLIGVIGLALFAFIAEEFFRSMQTTSAASKQQISEIYGETCNAQDFQKMVQDRQDALKFAQRVFAQTNPQLAQQIAQLSDEQIREMVWNDHVQYELIKHEADQLGLRVTDDEVKQALSEGTAQTLNLYLPMFSNGQTFDNTALQNFLDLYKKNKGKVQGAEMEQLEEVHRIWEYAEAELRKELLLNKYNLLFGATLATSNPIAAKYEWSASNDSTSVVIASLPFYAVTENVEVTDADLKKAYEANKELFNRDRLALPIKCDYRDVKFIDIAVTPNAKDSLELTTKMDQFYADLKAGDAQRIVRASNSLVAYSGNYMTIDAYQQFPDISSTISSMPVDSVTAPRFFMDNSGVTTMNIVKLLGKKEVADSVEVQMLPIAAADAAKSKTRCDSVMTAIKGGAAFNDVAKKLFPSDSTVYAAQKMTAKELNFAPNEIVDAIYNNGTGCYPISYQGGYFVLNILSKKGSVTVYDAAVVKCPLNFSNDTYNKAKSDLNIFLSANKDLASVEKNAKAKGYEVHTAYRVTPASQNIIDQSAYQAALANANPYYQPNENDYAVARSKDAVRWLFDEAKEGEMSPIYDCGANNDHILVVGLVKVNKEGYLPVEDPYVKQQLTAIVKSEKKAAIAAKKLAGVKSIDEAVQRGAISSERTVTFNAYDLEPKVAGAIAAQKEGSVSAPIVGTQGVYVVQVVKRIKGTGEYNERQMIRYAGNSAQRNVGGFIMDLAKNAKIADRRYKF